MQVQIWRAHYGVFNLLLIGVGCCLKMAVYILNPKTQNLHIRNISQTLMLCTKHDFQSGGFKENIFRIPIQQSLEIQGSNTEPIQIPSSCCQN